MAVTYEPITTQTLSSNQASVTFSTISGSYTDLVLVVAGTITDADYSLGLQFNSDTGSNYSYVLLNGSSTAATSSRDNNTTSVLVGSIDSAQSSSIISIQNYSNTTNYKTAIGRGNAGTSRTRLVFGQWRNTAAITSIIVTTNGSTFASGCTFTLYGILKA